ncbi:hypothetical protein Pla163_10820 [Planctomycetes bacterium Pla163]|uniref:Uncharacterized protein n=1 Tax=Rohdeia mirabilis TaxID=2528008 RepID=A0A518CXN0_9BACT|nr:hypothetical protein Pla163_10820 [Planctomycetes bacterium Pla163]
MRDSRTSAVFGHLVAATLFGILGSFTGRAIVDEPTAEWECTGDADLLEVRDSYDDSGDPHLEVTSQVLPKLGGSNTVPHPTQKAEGHPLLGYIVQKVTFTETYCECGIEAGVWFPWNCNTDEDSYWEIIPVHDDYPKCYDSFETGSLSIDWTPHGSFVIIGEAKFIHQADLTEANNPWLLKGWEGLTDLNAQNEVEVNGDFAGTGNYKNSKDMPEGLSWDDNFDGAGQDMGVHKLWVYWNLCDPTIPAHWWFGNEPTEADATD